MMSFLAAACVAAALLPSSASAIEKPVRGKKYQLTTQHGPWMIMVASFTTPPPDARTEGMTPEQAADELVFELRSKGMPAYTFATENKVDKVQTVDRLGEPDTRIFAAQRGNVCVLAGNYPGPGDKQAKASLDWIKHSFRPKFLTGGEADRVGMISLKNGGIYRATLDAKGKPEGPLVGAFFTTNPLLTSDQVRERNPERIDLLTKINAGGDCSLYDNKGKYTVVVASFYGQSVTLGNKTARRQSDGPSDALYQAAQDAWELARQLRKLKRDAYVWHDEHKSVVTVGSFDRIDDPRIPELISAYAAKIKPDAATNAPILAAEYLTDPPKPAAGEAVRKSWTFDPQPRLLVRSGKLWGPYQPGAPQ